MSFDCRGNKRGRCLDCIDCKEFTPWGKNIRCAYCDCPPTKHECFVGHELTATVNNASSPSQLGDDELQDKTHLQQHSSFSVHPSVNENSFTTAPPNDSSIGECQTVKASTFGFRPNTENEKSSNNHRKNRFWEKGKAIKSMLEIQFIKSFQFIIFSVQFSS